jgi:nitrate/nitrite transporter NarK
VHSLGYGASLLFFGVCCILFGHLIQRSGYLPRIIGILLAIAGFGYVGFSVAQMLSPAFAARALFPWVFPMAFVAELALCLWLMFKGVDIARWAERTQR